MPNNGWIMVGAVGDASRSIKVVVGKADSPKIGQAPEGLWQWSRKLHRSIYLEEESGGVSDTG